jgi:excisionase family DNA binding protein
MTMTLDDVRNSSAAVLSVAEVTELLTDMGGERIDKRTVLRACHDGQIPTIKVGRRILIPREALLAQFRAPAPDAA